MQLYRGDEDKSLAAPVLNPEKWSHEAIVARSDARPDNAEDIDQDSLALIPRNDELLSENRDA
jgi:hypothetical protein